MRDSNPGERAISKEVRDHLRTGDILIARLRTGKPLTHSEEALLTSYVAQIKSLVLTLQGYDRLSQHRDVVDALSKPEK